ncbi:hypothetical protein PoB_003095200 [Plakobranchus ocellatus]|uniref:Uncharacterized protein n=1 Tax=Plakobranchus ocellatus TaxID=259542 RepID=A0AAV4AB35_9GAST|nr:hypothetical protein PoB_003095200 [Plakobranchus ocellatus]
MLHVQPLQFRAPSSSNTRRAGGNNESALRNAGTLFSRVDSDPALKSAGTLLSRVRAPSPTPWHDGGPESLRPPSCGLTIRKRINQHLPSNPQLIS